MDGLKKLIREQPTILAAAIRQTLLAAVLIGLKLDETQVVGVMLAVESILTAINWAMVTPVSKAEEQVKDAKEQGRAEAIVERAMVPDLTPEEWTSLQELRRERDELNARKQRG